MTSLWVGVDGGASRCRVLVMDGAGVEVARVEGPAAAVDPENPPRSAGVVARTVGEALRGVPSGARVEGLWAGLAGAGREEVRSAVEGALALRMGGAHGPGARVPVAAVAVGTDMEAAFADAFDQGPGLLLVGGTGSVAVARGEDGGFHRVGGWGPLLGDEGSGYWLALTALRHVVATLDGREEATGLEATLLRVTGAGDARALTAWAAAATRSQVAGLVPRVVEAAEGGDALARTLLRDAARALAAHVPPLLEAAGPWNRTPALALAGGLLDPGGPLRVRVRGEVAPLAVSILNRRVDAARGAVTLARRLV